MKNNIVCLLIGITVLVFGISITYAIQNFEIVFRIAIGLTVLVCCWGLGKMVQMIWDSEKELRNENDHSSR